MVAFVQIKAIFLALFSLFFGLLPPCLLAIPFPLKIRLKIVSPLWSLCSKMMLRYACHCKIDINEDHRSSKYKVTPPYGLYVANHQSFLDIPLILTKYQAPPIMKKEILYIPIFGWLGWVSGALPVSRSKNNSRRKVFDQTKKRMLDEKIGVQVYPEGTRSKNATPRPFNDIKKTLLYFAYNEGLPVIPTSIYGTRGIISKSGMIIPGKHLGIIVHQEMYPGEYKTADDFSIAVWEKVIQGYDQMRELLGPLNEN